MSEAPDYVSPIEGWRLWLATTDDADAIRLTSVMQPIIWPVGEPVVATCRPRRSLFRSRRAEHPDLPSPVASCRCGIYAIDDPSRLSGFVDTNQGGRRYRNWIVGRASLWGTLIESDRGWRAALAYPTLLYVPVLGRKRRFTAEICEALREYGVPVEFLDKPITPRLLNKLRSLDSPAARDNPPDHAHRSHSLG
jgi:hypothetical protein